MKLLKLTKDFFNELGVMKYWVVFVTGIYIGFVLAVIILSPYVIK